MLFMRAKDGTLVNVEHLKSVCVVMVSAAKTSDDGLESTPAQYAVVGYDEYWQPPLAASKPWELGVILRGPCSQDEAVSYRRKLGQDYLGVND